MVKIKNTNFGIECSQKFEDLHKIGSENYCFHCQKYVIDFTAFSEFELKNYFKKFPKTCGSFDIEQIAKPIEIKPSISSAFYVFLVGLFSSFWVTKLSASEKKARTEISPNYDFTNNSEKSEKISNFKPEIFSRDSIKKSKKQYQKRSRRYRYYLSFRYPFFIKRRRLLGCIDF